SETDAKADLAAAALSGAALHNRKSRRESSFHSLVKALCCASPLHRGAALTAHKQPWNTINLSRSPHRMLAHATPSYACKLPTQPVCDTGSHLTGRSSIRKRAFHYSRNRALSLKCSKEASRRH